MPETGRRPDRDGVPPSITELVESHRSRTGDSYYDISRRGMRSGHTVSPKYLHRLGSGDVKGFPKAAETFAAIASGIETTELAVLLGYAVQLGVPVRMPRIASQLPYAVDSAPSRLQDALLVMARAVAAPDEAPHLRLSDDAVPDVTGAEGMLEDDDEHPHGAEEHA